MRRNLVSTCVTAVAMVLSSLLVLVAAPADAAAPKGSVTIVARAVHLPSAMAAGPDGNVWFLNDTDSIGRVTPAGAITMFGPPGIHHAGGITAGPDGNVWFTNRDAVGRITPAGAVTLFADPGITYAGAIAAGHDGNLWFTNGVGSIGRVTPSGSFTFFGSAATGGGAGIAAGPDGNMWFTFQHGIGRITLTGTVTTFTAVGISYPQGIAAGPDGDMWFTNYERQSVGRISMTGVVTFVTSPSIGNPTVIAAGPDGNMWINGVANSGTGSLARITPAGEVTRMPGGRTDGIATGPDGNLWFSESVEHTGRIGRRSASGTVTTFEGQRLGGPHAIVPGPDGNLWFTNQADHTIGRITPAGTLSIFTGAGIYTPTSIVTGPDGNLWFTNLASSSIGRITPTGVVSTFWGSGISYPFGIAPGPDGHLWFTNLLGDSIQRMTTSGVLVSTFTDPAIKTPGGIVAGPDGNMWFANGNANSIGRITPAGLVTTYTTNGLDGPLGITLGGDGNLWFTSSRTPAIGRITPSGAITIFTGAGIHGPNEHITAGPDGNVWFTNTTGLVTDVISKITPDGVVSTVATDVGNAFGITAGPDGNMWFTTRARSIGFVGTGVPSAPQAPSAVAAAGAAMVSWSAPLSDGGAPVTSYTVTAAPGGSTCTWTSGPLACTVTGLTNGSTYSFTISATNANGRSPASGPTLAATPTLPVAFHPLTPVRILDSRPAAQVGPYTGPWAPNQTRDVTVTGVGGVPAGADTVVLNVTVTGTTAPGYLTIWPSGQPRPTVSSLNWAAGQTVANAVTVKAGTDGKVSVFSSAGTPHVIVDAVGSYDTGPGDGYTPLTPARIHDSRLTGPAGNPWGPNQVREVTVAGAGGVPVDSHAVVVNVTVTGTTSAGYLTIWPAGEPRPTASSLNWAPGQTIANAVTVKTGAGGRIAVYNSTGATHVIVDIVGSFAPGTGHLFHALSPVRIQDSRPPGIGAYATPWAPGAARDVQVAGAGGIPSGAAAALLNVTATATTAAGYLTAAPSGQSPLASSLNWHAGQTVANSVTAKLGASGAISVRNPLGSTHVIADAAGWYG